VKWLLRRVRAAMFNAVTDDDGEFVDPWLVYEGVWDGRIEDGTRFGRPAWRYRQTRWGFPGRAPKRAQVVCHLPEAPYVAVAGTSRTEVERMLRREVTAMKAAR
jgi:hypothetical protein